MVKAHQDRTDLNDPDSHLLLSFAGTKLDCSKRLSRTLAYYGLNMTSTSIRSLVETETAGLFHNGAISLEEQRAVHNCNGHTNATANKHYIMPSQSSNLSARLQDAVVANSVLSKIHGVDYRSVHEQNPAVTIDLSQVT